MTSGSSLSCLPPFTLTLLSCFPRSLSSLKGPLFWKSEAVMKPMSSVLFLQRNTVCQMISHHLTCPRSGAHHCLHLLSYSVIPRAPVYWNTAAKALAEDHIESCHSSALSKSASLLTACSLKPFKHSLLSTCLPALSPHTLPVPLSPPSSA